MDLTKIDQPFGSLDIETKLALHRAHYEGKVFETKIHIIDPDRWIVTGDPAWLPRCPYRVRPEPLDISLPWAALDARWKWAARDEDGSVWVYDERPDPGTALWKYTGTALWKSGCLCLEITSLFANFDPGNKPWEESLIRRPEGA